MVDLATLPVMRSKTKSAITSISTADMGTVLSRADERGLRYTGAILDVPGLRESLVKWLWQHPDAQLSCTYKLEPRSFEVLWSSLLFDYLVSKKDCELILKAELHDLIYSCLQVLEQQGYVELHSILRWKRIPDLLRSRCPVRVWAKLHFDYTLKGEELQHRHWEVFDATIHQKESLEWIYANTVSTLVQNFCARVQSDKNNTAHGSCIAYGPSGSGKSYLLLTEPRSFLHLVYGQLCEALIEEERNKCFITIKEIEGTHQGQIRDLGEQILAQLEAQGVTDTSRSSHRPLNVRSPASTTKRSPNQRNEPKPVCGASDVFQSGLRAGKGRISFNLCNIRQLSKLIAEHRRTGVTDNNASSSRTHLLIKFHVGSATFAIGDLAGLESYQDGSGNIVNHLSALVGVWTALAEQKSYGNWRDSRLTSYLREMFLDVMAYRDSSKPTHGTFFTVNRNSKQNWQDLPRVIKSVAPYATNSA